MQRPESEIKEEKEEVMIGKSILSTEKVQRDTIIQMEQLKQL